MNINLLVVRESALVAYGEEEQGPAYAKDLARAQFVAELNERLGYPLSSIHLDVLVFAEGMGFQRIDVVAGGKENGVAIAAVVESPQAYEYLRERHLRGLFKSASVLAKNEKMRSLVYDTRWYEKGELHTRRIIIDYSAHSSYEAWQAAEFPSLADLPPYDA